MQDYIQRRVEERASVWEKMKALVDTAEAEKRGLSAEERESYDRMEKDLDGIDAEVRSLVAREKKDKEADELRSEVARLFGNAGGELQTDNEVSIRDIFNGKTNAIELAIPGDIQRRAGELTTNTNVAGKTIPVTLVERLYEELIHDSAVFGASTIITTASGEPLDFPRVTAANSTDAKVKATAGSQPVAEIGQLSNVQPVFDKVTITPSKYGVLLQISSELSQDTVVDLEGYVARSAAQGIQNTAGADLTATLIAGATDSGVTYSNFAAISTNTSGAATDALTDLVYAVPFRYRRRGSFFTSDAFVKAVRKIKDADSRPVWQPSLTAGEPDTIMGYPVVVDPDVPTSGAGAKVAVFGDLSVHHIRQVGSLRFESSADFAFDYDMVTYRCIWRGGSAVLDTQALKWADITA